MNILITGGAGFIGSWLIEALVASGHQMVVVDNLSPQIHGAIPQAQMPWLCNKAVEFIRADIRDYAVMDKALARVDAVVHLAAETGTGQSMYQISHYYDVNQQATASLFEAIGTKHRHIKRVILASSRSIYGEGAYTLNGDLYVPQPRSQEHMNRGEFEPVGPKGEQLELIPTPEYAQPKPASIYAATKLANETLGQIFSDAYKVPVIALRFQNVYGERQSLQNPYTGILSIFSNRMRQNLPINIFEDGNESRDFVHVHDVVRALDLALHLPLNDFQAINVGSGTNISVMEVATLLRKLLNSSSTLSVTGDFRTGDIRHCFADLKKAQQVLDFEPRLNIEEGMQKFCLWVEQQPIIVDRSQSAMSNLANLGLGRSHV